VSEPQVDIPAACEIHGGSGHLLIRREGNQILLDGRADQCYVFSLPDASVTLLFDVLGELLP
jgi:hypothetical protein